MIYIIIGKSSSGKDTILKKLLKIRKLKLKKLVEYTTRPIRKGEKNGKNYFFVTEDKMVELQESGKVIEHRQYTTINGVWHYFTVDQLEDSERKSNNNYIIITSLEAYCKIKSYFGAEKVVPLYVAVDRRERMSRAFLRESIQDEPKFDEISRRFRADDIDMSDKNLISAGIDYIYDNANLASCCKELACTIDSLNKTRNK